MAEETQTRKQSSEPRSRSSRPQRQSRRYFRRRRRVCAFCVDKTKIIDWKNVDLLQRFVTQSGSIQGRRKTGTCAKHQRHLAAAIKRARFMALLPYTGHQARIAKRA